MAKIEKFEDLDIWKQSRELCKMIYQATRNTNFANDYGLKNQITRAAGSIMDNIAEGFDRDGKKEFIQFLSIAKSSAAEVRSQLYRALDQDYLNQEEFKILQQKTTEIGKMLGGFMNYLIKSDVKGLKYKIEEPESNYGQI